jgi:hypothetical protein
MHRQQRQIPPVHLRFRPILPRERFTREKDHEDSRANKLSSKSRVPTAVYAEQLHLAIVFKSFFERKLQVNASRYGKGPTCWHEMSETVHAQMPSERRFRKWQGRFAFLHIN